MTNMTPPKETHKAVISDPKEMEIYKLLKNSEQSSWRSLVNYKNIQLYKIRKTMQEQNKFNKEAIKKPQNRNPRA